MRYFISDLHFFHGSLNEQMDHRGFSSEEEMHEVMIRQWNSRVRENDEVVILGDLSLGTGKQTNEILRELRGKKYLIEGNHDKFLNDRHFDRSLFVWIKPYAELKDNHRKVVLSHYPMPCYNGQYRVGEADAPKAFMLYGHVHNTQDEALIQQFQNEIRRQILPARGERPEQSIPCHMINCFCMFSDYVPLTLEEWLIVDEKRRATIPPFVPGIAVAPPMFPERK